MTEVAIRVDRTLTGKTMTSPSCIPTTKKSASHDRVEGRKGYGMMSLAGAAVATLYPSSTAHQWQRESNAWYARSGAIKYDSPSVCSPDPRIRGSAHLMWSPDLAQAAVVVGSRSLCWWHVGTKFMSCIYTCRQNHRSREVAIWARLLCWVLRAEKQAPSSRKNGRGVCPLIGESTALNFSLKEFTQYYFYALSSLGEFTQYYFYF